MISQLRTITEVGTSSDRALLIRLPNDLLSKIETLEDGNVDPIGLARALLALPEDEFEYKSEIEDDPSQKMSLMRLIFDQSIAVEK